MNDPKQRTAKPASLLSQWWTLGTIATDSRTVGRHFAVAWVIIDRFMQKRGNGRASIRYLEKATGLSQHTIIKACRELVQWGFFTAHISHGRATEYTPKWSVLHPSTALSGAEPLYSASADLMCSTSAKSAAPMFSESCLPEPADKPASREVEDSSDGAATPPHAAGLSAASGVTPPGASARIPDTLGGFEEFWNSYAHKQKRDKAEAAWAKLDPSPDLAATIISEAGRWAAHYVEHNVEKNWRAMPHNWLASKSWTCDLPIIYTDPKSAAIGKVRGSAKPKPAKQSSEAKPSQRARTTARITSTEVVTTGSATELRIVATDGDGVEHERIMDLEHDDAETQFEGQRLLAKLVDAAGLKEISCSSELHGRTIVITLDGFVAPTTRPDDDAPIPVRPEPVLYANTVGEPAEPNHAAREWEQRYRARQVGNAARKEWDKAHPELFKDTLPPQPDDWPEWLDAEFEEDDAA
jgi:hypothetical protein